MEDRIMSLYRSTDGLWKGTRVSAALFVESLRGLSDDAIDLSIEDQIEVSSGPFKAWLVSQRRS